jgi:hypothetical protein
MHRPLCAALVAAVLSVVGVVYAAPSVALAKIKCDAPNGVELRKGSDVAVFTGAIDPIVNHGEPAAAHTHDFFGSFGWQGQYGNDATYGAVVTGPTNCREQGDTGSYWAPVLRYISGPKVGQRVPVQQFTAYYRGFAGQTTHAGSQPFPEDVRLVATDDKGYGARGWNCGQFSAQAAREGTVDAIPDCTGEDGTPGNTLTAHINFPSCWNGNLPNHGSDEYGDTRDNADWTYPTNKTACPATHPIEVVQLRETIQYIYTGNGTDIALDSDEHSGTSDGRSMHADFWNTWDQEALRQTVRNCINTAAEANCAP